MSITTTPVRLARAGVVLSVLAVGGIAVALLVAGQPAEPASALLAATAAMLAATIAAVRLQVVAPRRTVTVGRRAREHVDPLSAAPASTHPDTDGHVRSRAPGRSLPAV